MLFHILGPLEAHAPGGRELAIKPGKPTAVLAALLLERGKWVGVDRLIDAAWPDRTPPASARGNLKSYVCGLRATLAPAASGARIESRPGGYRVVVDHGQVDADRVEHDGDRARRALRAGTPERAAELLTPALRLWRGTPFDELRTPAARTETARLQRLHAQLRADLADAHHALGRHLDALPLLHDLLDEDPLREQIWARLVRALAESGQRGEALAAYRRARTIIVRELGVEPGAALAATHRDVLLGSTGDRPWQLPVAAGSRPPTASMSSQPLHV
ncbi:AfsR/SARP family transcriptional regulator [Amycolatopsis sp. MtRt-6]|uniref:AfsR/SARP family transcriptional regulator n=1 Tax=Amycolatopsis sp. MtRt-6 TaxID=2792782 RepID=UPI001A8F22F5|nr:AfsR/SARP family transcriptional regulator [Amycolatopsis sp. MtRt-6]